MIFFLILYFYLKNFMNTKNITSIQNKCVCKKKLSTKHDLEHEKFNSMHVVLNLVQLHK